MTLYAGVPEHETLTDYYAELQTKAMEQQIRGAIRVLTEGQSGKFAAVVGLLGLFVGDTQK